MADSPAAPIRALFICHYNRKRSATAERIFGKASRTFTLPQEVDEAKAEAKFRDGVLELALPKKSATQRKQISIQ